ncbi:hypothetical protein, partial [Mycobacteroides abscessus]|uniref:hypothetical protein n=2 Tax=Mycobacteroides abscessus TaxID=36809 RepID=UPI001C26B36B
QPTRHPNHRPTAADRSTPSIMKSRYAICNSDGQFLYGWEQADFEENAPQDIKQGPIIGYQYIGPTAALVDQTLDGAVDTGKIVETGDWFVRWRDSRKLIVMKDHEFWGLHATH